MHRLSTGGAVNFERQGYPDLATAPAVDHNIAGERAPESKPSLTHSFAPLRSIALARSCPARRQGFGIEHLLKPLHLILGRSPAAAAASSRIVSVAEISTDLEEIILDAESVAQNRATIIADSSANPIDLDRSLIGRGP
jgi:hypothetical protein